MKEFYFIAMMTVLIIVDIIQGAMLTALRNELEFVSRIVSTYMRQKAETISKNNAKSGDFEGKERR